MTSHGNTRTSALVGAGILALTMLAACEPDTRIWNESTTPEDEWQMLFDGTSLDSWTAAKGSEVGKQWQIIDRTLVLTAGGGGDLISKDKYENFELQVEWRISEKGDSGILYKVADTHGPIGKGALEYQLLDDNNSRYDDPINFTASLYGMYAPETHVHRPAGSWNHTRIVVRGKYVEHWLNDERVVKFTIDSDDWRRSLASKDYPEGEQPGEAKAGHIALQDNGDMVWFRQIRIRPINGKHNDKEVKTEEIVEIIDEPGR